MFGNNLLLTIIILVLLLVSSGVKAQNILTNSDFETGDLTGWSGFNNQNLTDNLTTSEVGNINNGEGSLFQVVTVLPGETYILTLDYRWVSGSGNYNMNVTLRDEATNNLIEQFPLSSTPDQWFNVTRKFTVPSGVTDLRILLYKTNGNRPARFDNVVINRFDGNLIQNSRFENFTGNVLSDWNGFKNRPLIDNITGSEVGDIENSDGSLFQEISVIPYVTYDVNFEYRWDSSGVGPDTNLTVRVKEVGNLSNNLVLIGSNNGNGDGYNLSSVTDEWIQGHFSFKVPTGINDIRLLFFKGLNNLPIKFDNVSIVQNYDLTDEADYYFRNGSWAPTTPYSISTSADNILIFNGKATINNELVANNLEVEEWADVNVENVLDISNTITVKTGSEFVFKNNNAVLGQIKNGTVNGEVIVERYIPTLTTGRSFRFLTSPVNSTGSIFDNWQEKGRIVIDQYGTHITGDSAGNNGFDATPSGNPSMFTFDNSFSGNQDSAWQEIPNTDVRQLNAGEPFVLFVRGDRKYDLSTLPSPAPNNDVVLRSKGSLVDFSSTPSTVLSSEADYFSLVANPYQAKIDFTQLNFNGDVNPNNLYVFKPSPAPNYGSYETIDISSPASDKIIQPGQSFFVVNQASGGSSSLEYPQVAVNTNGNITDVFNEQYYHIADIGLYNSDNIRIDVLKLRFSENGNNDYEAFDAPKLFNQGENIYTYINNLPLSVENRNIPDDNEELEFYINNYQFENYEFRVGLDNWNEDLDIYVVDNYLATETIITPNVNYQFSVDTTIPQSMATDRFSLKFSNSTLGIIENASEDDFNLYPNPSPDGFFSIKLNKQTNYADIEIIDILGKQVYKGILDIEGQEVRISPNNKLQNGLYIVKVRQGNIWSTKKLIVK
jgi:hypothetical protein